MAASRFRLIILSSMPSRQVARIIRRIRRDLAEVEIVGVLYERVRHKTLRQRVTIWRKKMTRPIYWRYVAHRIFAAIARSLAGVLDRVIHLVHASPTLPNGDRSYGLDDLEEFCQSSGTEFLIAEDIHSEEALDFARRQNADLGLVFGTRILKPVLYEIPRQGSINVHKRKVPDTAVAVRLGSGSCWTIRKRWGLLCTVSKRRSTSGQLFAPRRFRSSPLMTWKAWL